MPYLLDNKAVFFHTPKTGGSWVRRAVVEAGIPVAEIIFPLHHGHNGKEIITINNIAHMPPLKLKGLSEKFFTFAFIRHPLTWLQSVFRHHLKRGWGNTIIDEKVKSTGFNEFVKKYTTIFPGLAGKNMELYCKEVGFVGRYENLAEDLIKALTLAKLDFDAEKIRKTPRVNVGDAKIRTEYSQKNLERVKKAEADFIKKYYGDCSS